MMSRLLTWLSATSHRGHSRIAPTSSTAACQPIHTQGRASELRIAWVWTDRPQHPYPPSNVSTESEFGGPPYGWTS
ncbi:hypothetical protein CEP53_001992 [Fusarium sp. AF-6]|nr:hypothetical protein CEP53_001992 [Fusarium sp. AF-6]